MTHVGRRPTRPTAMWKENGEVTRSPEEVKQRWHDHFSDVLNVPSQYRQGTIDELPNHPTEWELDDPPTCEEFWVFAEVHLSSPPPVSGDKEESV